jgi:hypothetical protein
MSALLLLLNGFFFGVQHSTEVDHVVAVSTFLTKKKNLMSSIMTGVSWGLGHTLVLFVFGLFVLLLKLQIPLNLEEKLDKFIAVLIILLGLRLFFSGEGPLHQHDHSHDGKTHSHLHTELSTEKEGGAVHFHEHKHSFLLGTVHGLAGSGSLMLIVLATVPTTALGIAYILLFGLGCIVGMSIISVILSVPILKMSPGKEVGFTGTFIRLVTGFISLVVGVSMLMK